MPRLPRRCSASKMSWRGAASVERPSPTSADVAVVAEVLGVAVSVEAAVAAAVAEEANAVEWEERLEVVVEAAPTAA